MTDHTIPAMRDMCTTLHTMTLRCPVNFATKCITCLVDIEYNLEQLGEHADREQTVKRGLRMMKDALGKRCPLFCVYGGLLHSLARVYELTGHTERAFRAYGYAASAKRSAEDYGDDGEKQRDIERSESCLERLSE